MLLKIKSWTKSFYSHERPWYKHVCVLTFKLTALQGCEKPGSILLMTSSWLPGCQVLCSCPSFRMSNLQSLSLFSMANPLTLTTSVLPTELLWVCSCLLSEGGQKWTEHYRCSLKCGLIPCSLSAQKVILAYNSIELKFGLPLAHWEKM